MNVILLLGRILFSTIFILSSFSHFSQETFQFAASKDVPFPSLLVPLSGIMLLLGGLSILFGYKARWGASLIALFLIPVTLMMHNFWKIADPATATTEQYMFMKNIALLGSALMLTYFGSGPLSIDKPNRK